MDHGGFAGRHSRRLTAALSVSLTLLILEVVAGIASHSLALLADAGHLLADVVGMALSLGAIAIAARPRTTGRTFGLYRLEILVASVNAVVLLGVGPSWGSRPSVASRNPRRWRGLLSLSSPRSR
jgi:cobalt-zinc-cadmium efflux system protein